MGMRNFSEGVGFTARFSKAVNVRTAAGAPVLLTGESLLLYRYRKFVSTGHALLLRGGASLSKSDVMHCGKILDAASARNHLLSIGRDVRWNAT